MNQAGIDLIKSFESLSLKAYPDPKTGGAPWTNGWGSTGPDIGPGTVWTRERADLRFKVDVQVAEDLTYVHVKVPLNENQRAALTSLIYNVGAGRVRRGVFPGRSGIIRLNTGAPSTLLRKLNAGDYDGARDQFLKWVSPGSSVERGLRRRRKAEVALWNTPVA